MNKEDLEAAIDSLIEKYGDQLPNPEHYPKIAKTLIVHEMYEIEQKKLRGEGDERTN